MMTITCWILWIPLRPELAGEGLVEVELELASPRLGTS
jgi:hypothetical protein